MDLYSIVSMFYCATLEEVVGKALEGEGTHRIYHANRAQEQSMQLGRQRHRPHDEDQQDLSQKQRAENTLALLAV